MRGRDIKELIRSPKIYMFVSVYCVCVSECSCLWVSFQYDFPLVVILFRTQAPKPIQSISFTFFSAMMPLMFVNFEKKNNKHWSLLFFFLVLFVMCRYRKVKNSFSIRNRFYFRFNGFSLPTPRFAFVVIVEFFFARRFLSSIITYPCLVATIAFNCIRCDSQFGSI